mgnify:FL=1
MSFKERQEYAALEADIAALEAEKQEIVAKLSGASISVDEITELSKRLPVVDAVLDEKSMRWLELSELE